MLESATGLFDLGFNVAWFSQCTRIRHQTT